MKELERLYSSFGFTNLDIAQKEGLGHAFGTGGREKISWTSFLIRNDFGIVAEKHEDINKLSRFISIGVEHGIG